MTLKYNLLLTHSIYLVTIAAMSSSTDSSHSNNEIEIEIDPAGDTYLKVTSHSSDTSLQELTLFKVSKQILLSNSTSASFNSHLLTSTSTSTSTSTNPTHHPTIEISLHDTRVENFEIWLRILHHGDLPNEMWTQLDMNDIEEVWKLGVEYGFELERFNVWFAFWLGNLNLRRSRPFALIKIGGLCEVFQHRVGGECITALADTVNDRQLPRAFFLYPPVPVMSTRQNSILIFFTRIVPMREYERWGFSANFQAIYGEALEYYSDFYRFMTTSFDRRVVPGLKRFGSLGGDGLSRFLWFCQMSDDIARRENLPMLNRRQMEAAWVWTAFDLYEKDDDVEPFILKKVIGERLHPRNKVEEYWAEKGARFGWAVKYVEFLDNGCEEDPETETVAEEDEEEEEDKDEDVEMEMEKDVGVVERPSAELGGLVYRIRGAGARSGDD